MSGTLARPAAAPSLPGVVLGAANSRRLAFAALAVVVVHGAVLAVRPGASAGDHVPPAASSVMAIRMVRPTASVANAATVTPPAPVAELAAAPQPLAEPAMSASAKPTPADAAPAGMQPLGRAAPAPDGGRSSSPPITSDSKAAEAALPAAPDYAFGVRLDPGPRPLEDIEPEYPDMTYLREGIVVLRLLISETGRVDDVGVVRAEPRGVFEQAAVEAFSKARFSPGLAAGTPVKSQITVEVQFMPINRGARVSGRTY